MSTALFLLLPTTSHYTSCLPLATELKQNGYDIVFAGSMSGREIVESNNFLFIEFSYMSTYNASTFRNVIGTLLMNLTDRRKSKGRFREFNDSIYHLNSCLKKVNPTLVFIDEHLSHYYAYIIRKVANVCIINTKLPTGKSTGVPPLNSPYLPSNNSLRNLLICEALWTCIIFRKYLYKTINRIAFLGLTTEAFHNRFIRKSGMPIQYTVKSCFEDYDNLVNAPTLILLSERFNFPWRKRNPLDFFYHSWNIDPMPLDSFLAETVKNFKGRKKIIYCGIGKMPGKSIDDYARFFIQVVTFAKSTDEFIFILSTAVPQITNMLRNFGTPEYVFVYDHVAQQDLLKHVDIMITHGGLNSVKECIFNQVPMLAVSNPSHGNTDTLGNISRIVYHKIGLKCSIGDSAHVVQKKIEALASDESFKSRITILKDKMDDDQISFYKLGVFHSFDILN